MAVTPEIAALADQMRQAMPAGMTAVPLTDLRAMTEMMVPPSAEQVAHVMDVSVPGPAGPVPVRAYRPDDDGPLPVIVWLHGGGFAIGGLTFGDDLCRRLANAVHAVVVNVDYRLAPENPYPAGLDDCVTVFDWVLGGPPELGPIDADRTAVAGDSAGGNLAMALVLRARDRGRTLPTCHVSIYGTADMVVSNPELGDLPFLTSQDAHWFWDTYVADEGARDDPYVNPARATTLGGISPLMIVTAGHDPTRDASEAYGRRAADAGVPVVSTRWDGTQHGFLSMVGGLPQADDAFDAIVAYLNGHLHPSDD